jgi:hypothetical protein
VVHDTDGLGSGCVLCHEPDFLRGAFGERTIMICDTCEREFHVGCLRSTGRADLKEVRGGDSSAVHIMQGGDVVRFKVLQGRQAEMLS